MSVVSRVLSQLRTPVALSFHQGQINTLLDVRAKSFTRQVSTLHNMSASFFQRLGFSSPASSEGSQSICEKTSAVEFDAAARVEPNEDEDAKDQADAEEEISDNDLVKLVTEKDELLQTKQKEIEAMKDKVLRSYAEMENVMQRTKREAENSKKVLPRACWMFTDNLGRASSVVKESFAKIDTATDTSATVPLPKTLLEGVEMTEKQLQDVFKKSGIKKYEPVDELFDPNRHNAVFQVPDATVAVVHEAGYLLHERVLRPAEVGVRVAPAEESG